MLSYLLHGRSSILFIGKRALEFQQWVVHIARMTLLTIVGRWKTFTSSHEEPLNLIVSPYIIVAINNYNIVLSLNTKTNATRVGGCSPLLILHRGIDANRIQDFNLIDITFFCSFRHLKWLLMLMNRDYFRNPRTHECKAISAKRGYSDCPWDGILSEQTDDYFSRINLRL